MMKILQINATCGVGSTGKICVGISRLLTENNVDNYILYSSRSNGYELGISCADDKYIKLQALKSRVFGNYGFNSVAATKRMIAEIERLGPDVVHLHNIHGHDCNLEMLFGYFRKNKTRLIWTFHDCWAFTGYCTYFTAVKCEKWQTVCSDCIQKSGYSWFSDKSHKLFCKKRELFKGIDMTIVTPSLWLADLLKQSFLSEYPVKVINNGIDLDVFRYDSGDFRRKYALENKKVVLGVSMGWDERKGLDVFVELAKRLPEEYKIVLVGTDDNADRLITDNIISIHRTENQQELAKIYSAADVFVNPTREDNYPTVNIEAIACGTPVVTFKTGGSPEMIDESCGSVVECDDIAALEKEIIRICTDKPYSRENCTIKAKSFDKNVRFKEYLKLYERVNTSGAKRY